MSTVDLASVPVGPIVLHIYQFPLGIPSPAPVHALYLVNKKTNNFYENRSIRMQVQNEIHRSCNLGQNYLKQM